MKFNPLYYYILIFSFYSYANAYLITTAVSIAVGAALMKVWSLTDCIRKECCHGKWIIFNPEGLSSTLLRSLYGQNIVRSIAVEAIRNHLREENPQKALAMSFHGSTGVGKNYATQFIAEHLYFKGMNSKFVHLYLTTADFPHETLEDSELKKLRHQIQEYSKHCQRLLFIFDETDKMPRGVFDIIQSFVMFSPDFKRHIFILLSNSGGKEIANITLSLRKNGIERSDIKIEDFNHLINSGAFRDKGYVPDKGIDFIDAYIPFLPLEREQVEMCIWDRLKDRSRGFYRGKVDDILNEIEFYPRESPLFAESGCKRINQRIAMHVDHDE